MITLGDLGLTILIIGAVYGANDKPKRGTFYTALAVVIFLLELLVVEGVI